MRKTGIHITNPTPYETSILSSSLIRKDWTCTVLTLKGEVYLHHTHWEIIGDKLLIAVTPKSERNWVLLTDINSLTLTHI